MIKNFTGKFTNVLFLVHNTFWLTWPIWLIVRWFSLVSIWIRSSGIWFQTGSDWFRTLTLISWYSPFLVSSCGFRLFLVSTDQIVSVWICFDLFGNCLFSLKCSALWVAHIEGFFIINKTYTSLQMVLPPFLLLSVILFWRCPYKIFTLCIHLALLWPECQLFSAVYD